MVMCWSVEHNKICYVTGSLNYWSCSIETPVYCSYCIRTEEVIMIENVSLVGCDNVSLGESEDLVGCDIVSLREWVDLVGCDIVSWVSQWILWAVTLCHG